MKSAGLSHTFLITPTTSEARMRKIDSLSQGFVYAVSSSSTTGVKSGFSFEQENYFKKLQHLQLKNPLLIGFGISSSETFTVACRYSQGAIVGSAFINLLEKSKNLKSDIQEFVQSIKHES
jgi:tryptophan synthase alpha chain